MKITKSRMNKYYLLLLKYFNKKDNSYFMKGLHRFEPIYIYGNSYYPLGIIVGRQIQIKEYDVDYFNLQYIWVRKKRQGIASVFLKSLIQQYNIHSINYLSGSVEGKIFFEKMQNYFKANNIQDHSLDQRHFI